MSRTVTLDLTGDAAVFPARCVGCGGAPTTESTLAFAKVVTTASGRQTPVQQRVPVPHCAACARATKAVFLASLLPFLLGLLVAGGAAFLVVGYGALRFGLDDMGRPGNANSLVVASAAALAAGLAGGFVLELATRALLLPVFGQALWRAPLLASTLLTDVDYVAGVTGRPNADLSAVTLTFALDDVAAEVDAANAPLTRVSSAGR